MAWYRNLALSRKLSLTFGLVLLLTFAGLIFMNLNQLRSVSLGKGELEAEVAGKHFSQSFRDQLVGLESTLSTTSDALLNARETKKLSRDDVIQMLQNLLEHEPDIMGLYTLWEPNAFDNNDKQHINKTPHDDATGRFIPYAVRSEGKIIVEALHDYEVEGAGNYYLLAKRSKKLTLLEPYSYKVNGKAVLMTSLILPVVDKQGTFLGIVGADLSLADLQKKAEKEKPLGGYVSIVSAKGVYAAQGNLPELVSAPYTDRPEKQAIWDGVKAGVFKHYSANTSGQSVIRIFEPLQLPGSSDVWYTETVVPEATVLQSYNESMIGSITIAVAAMLIIGGLLTLVIHRVIVRRVKAMSELLLKLSEGDFRSSMEVNSNDEFGTMAKHFNTMIAKLRAMLQLVSDLAMSVGATSQQLTAGAEQTSRAAETIADSVQQVAIGAESQETHALDSSRAMTEMAVGIQRIAESAQVVTESAHDAGKLTEAGNAQIQDAVRQMTVVQATVSQSQEAIQQLGQRSEEIGSIIGLISGISTQTNLLALNAAIEASRVGEHGKGFAVVAGEVRKLAEQSRAAAEQIAGLIDEIRSDTAQAVAAMGQGTAEVEKGVITVTESGARFASIMEEMMQVNDQIQEVSAAAEQMSASSQQVTATVEQLALIAKEASLNSQGVAAASEEQLASMQEISSSASALSSMVQELLDQLAHFKV
ncbi:methyl-accepting chemotaxis protein [Paenibacillus sp. H1-7]|uniref:methyl-accepting chemotaxis protein n=1 Tax=Paenibacillus sp. H1-7 TaxID=2282849 RepID=UPI001EF75A8D|nr:methyl-accepting chemotaxis protein [Paenibacillus sp. H1-7]ULL13253.1 methyl-accepting chemotaxis protein [Paenibacillus sp. H1-7]